MVYIGDNPLKDFVGIKPLWVRTIRVRRGMFQDVEAENGKFEAEYEIDSLYELFPITDNWRKKG
ncbi:hypothetical protein D3C75_355750 [compost metagenome]